MLRVAIYGYGNLGKGIECAIDRTEDMTLYGVFTRRDPSTLTLRTEGVPVFSANDILAHKGKIDILIICGGSATDLPEMTPMLAEHFNVLDSFDTHASIPTHFERTDEAAKKGGNTAMISAGWDPGMFSLARLYASAILPSGKTETFWGRGVSQGHSDAIRRIDGVLDARQYTVPKKAALDAVLSGEMPTLTARDKHTRECYVVAKEGADLARIEREIKTMPNYFADYDTSVTFITEEELKRDHTGMPHGGTVIRGGETGMNGKTHRHTVSYTLNLESNPEFTASALVAFARAICRMHEKGDTGCKTVFDVPPALLSPLSSEELRKSLL